MFTQVIKGQTSDAAGVKRVFDQWEADLAPGAAGWLGTTAGVADDGTVIVIARFESEAAARANSDRPEQGTWWAEAQKHLDEGVHFHDSTDVETILAGGSDAAGFVQIIVGRVTDRARLKEFESRFMDTMATMRPDLIGSVRGWYGERFIEAAYFTDEAAARAGESSSATGAVAEGMAEWQSLVGDLTFIDLRDPWLTSAG